MWISKGSCAATLGVTASASNATTAHRAAFTSIVLQDRAYSSYRVKPMNPDKRFSIGEAEKATGVKVVTIRYYEQIGLMPKPMRTKGNYRTYNQEHLARLVFIRRCRDLGFTLRQIHDFVALSAQDEGACAEVDRITTTHLKEI